MTSSAIFYSPGIILTAKDMTLCKRFSEACSVCGEGFEPKEHRMAMASGEQTNPPVFEPAELLTRCYATAHTVCWYGRTMKHLQGVQIDGKGMQLVTWAVYGEDKPRVWPFSARAFVLDKPTSFVVVCESLDPIERLFEHVGLYRINERGQGDPDVLEAWI